jgi:hypothetical protein
MLSDLINYNCDNIWDYAFLWYDYTNYAYIIYVNGNRIAEDLIQWILSELSTYW